MWNFVSTDACRFRPVVQQCYEALRFVETAEPSRFCRQSIGRSCSARTALGGGNPRSSRTAPCRVDLAGGTVDIWPLYLFIRVPSPLIVAIDIRTRCRVAPLGSPEIHLSSIDTGLEDRLSGFEALYQAAHRRPRHALAAHLLRFFYPQGTRPRGGLWLETESDAPAGAGISGSSALMIATTAVLARHTGRALYT